MTKQKNLSLETNWVSSSAETLGLKSSIIGLSGARELTEADRKLYKKLLRNASESDDPRSARKFTIGMSDLEGALGSRSDVIRSIVALMQTIVIFRKPNGSTMRVQLLGGTTTPADHLPGDLKYTIQEPLRELIWSDPPSDPIEIQPKPELISQPNAEHQKA